MVVLADRAGYLGNALLLFGHLVALSLVSGVRIANPSFAPYARWFRATAGDPFCRFPGVDSRSPRVVREPAFVAARGLAAICARTSLLERWVDLLRVDIGERLDLSDPAFLARARARKLLLLQGWLMRHQSGFEQHSETIRSFLRPTEQIEGNVAAAVARLRERHGFLIGVHGRRGDYRAHLGGRYYFSWGEYASRARDLYSLVEQRAPIFVISSNEDVPDGVLGGLPTFRTSGHPATDLFTLAACDLIVGPPSSFSLWASFYGEVPLQLLVHEGARITGLDNARVMPDITERSVRELYWI